MTCISITVLHKSSLCDQQVELMPCKVWQGCPLRQKKRAEKEACKFAFSSRADGASAIHMHEAYGCQPITLTPCYGIVTLRLNGREWDQSELRWQGFIPWVGKVTLVFQAGPEPMKECLSSPQHLPWCMQC